MKMVQMLGKPKNMWNIHSRQGSNCFKTEAEKRMVVTGNYDMVKSELLCNRCKIWIQMILYCTVKNVLRIALILNVLSTSTYIYICGMYYCVYLYAHRGMCVCVYVLCIYIYIYIKYWYLIWKLAFMFPYYNKLFIFIIEDYFIINM